MDSFESLDLCISCGNHVPDGTPYCSQRCRNVDLVQQQQPSHPSGSSSNVYYAGSSSHHSLSQPSHPPTSSRRRRPLLDFYPEEQQHDQVRRLASIAEWAQGVYGASQEEEDHHRQVAVQVVDDEDDDSTYLRFKPKRSLPIAASISPKRTSTRRASKPRYYSPPRFTLTAQNLAPPAMSIALTVDDSDVSSIATPSSSPRPLPIKSRKDTNVDPWISSPPYEFADRGRPLVRV